MDFRLAQREREKEQKLLFNLASRNLGLHLLQGKELILLTIYIVRHSKVQEDSSAAQEIQEIIKGKKFRNLQKYAFED